MGGQRGFRLRSLKRASGQPPAPSSGSPRSHVRNVRGRTAPTLADRRCAKQPGCISRPSSLRPTAGAGATSSAGLRIG
eukprot:13433606-Alexandrium_andersonii.AAC.1